MHLNIFNFQLHTAKAGLIDHISPVRLQFTYIAKQQILNSGFWWSKCIRQTLVKVTDFSIYKGFQRIIF